MSDLDAILDGLRDRATGWSCVPLADAVAAVHAAADTARGETWDAAQAAPHCFSEYGTPCGNCPVAEKPETDT